MTRSYPTPARLALLAFLISSGLHLAAEETAETIVKRAYTEFTNGKTDDALTLAGKAIAAFPKNPAGYAARAQIYSHLHNTEAALADFDSVLKLAPDEPRIYQLRGCEHFRAGHFKDSIADFDKYIDSNPDQEAQHWQRGISYYYAGRYADGRKQFELHKTVNPEDVENAAWHYLCVARIEGVEKARAALIDVGADARVPMKEIFALFKGEGKPEDVMAAATLNNPPPQRLKEHLFYAHLYLGLYYEAAGKKDLARGHILKAADEFAGEDYMGDVARVHAALLRKQ